MRTTSPLSHSLQDEGGLDNEDQDTFLSSENSAGAISKDDGEDREILQESVSSAAWGHERVVQVPNETARWVFTNQAEPEEATSTQASTFHCQVHQSPMHCITITSLIRKAHNHVA